MVDRFLKSRRCFNGFSPWGYAPGYMIHDWMFVGRHCHVDGEPGSRFDQIRDVGFDDSATILAEAIQALVASNQVKANDVAGVARSIALLQKIFGTRPGHSPGQLIWPSFGFAG
jgi:hypothetical protein